MFTLLSWLSCLEVDGRWSYRWPQLETERNSAFVGKFGIFYTGSQDVCSRCLKQRDLMFLMRPRSSPAVFVVTTAGVSFKETWGQMHTYIYWCHVGFEWHCSHRIGPNQSSSSDSWEKQHTHKTGVLCSSLLLLLLIIVTLIKQGAAASVTDQICLGCRCSLSVQ